MPHFNAMFFLEKCGNRLVISYLLVMIFEEGLLKCRIITLGCGRS
jgi:hypothetical protein